MQENVWFYNYYNYYGCFLTHHRLKGSLLSDLSALQDYAIKSKAYMVDRWFLVSVRQIYIDLDSVLCEFYRYTKRRDRMC